MTRSLCIAALVTLLSPTTHLDAQSLAGVAKKAQEDRADKPPAKVYTNKDLPDAPPAVPPPPALPPSETPSTTTGSTSKATTSALETKDENWWRSRATTLRRTLADNQTKLVAAKAHYDSLPPEARGVTGAPIVEAWMKAKEEISRLLAVVANDQRALEELQDEARRAGVVPGWLRER